MILILLLSLLCLPLQCMEIEIDEWEDEDAPLLQEIAIDQQIEDQEDQKEIENEFEDPEENELPILFDGSRRSYDDASHKQAKIKLLKEYLKSSAKHIVPINIAGGILGSVIGLFFPGYLNSLMWGLLAGATCVEIPLWTLGLYWCKRGTINEDHNFMPYEAQRCCLMDEVVKPLLLSPELLDVARDNAICWMTTKEIQAMCNKKISHCEKNVRFWKLRRNISPYYKNDYELLERIKNHLNTDFKYEYKQTGYALKRLLRDKLNHDMVRKIFSYFPNKNIIKQMQPYQTNPHIEDFNYLTEKELLYLARDIPVYYSDLIGNEVGAYLLMSELSDNGWLAFKKSEKYPIKLNMSYFDEDSLPENAQWYYQKVEGFPSVYFPFSRELAQYYKFEEDPAYQMQYEEPENAHIAALLRRRQELIEQQDNQG